jgi:hypothetical protein
LFPNFFYTIFVNGKCRKGKEGKRGRFDTILLERKEERKEDESCPFSSHFVTGKKVKGGKEGGSAPSRPFLPTASRPVGRELRGEII